MNRKMTSFFITPLALKELELKEPYSVEPDATKPDVKELPETKLYTIKSNLNRVKSKLDDLYKLKNAQNIMRSFDPFISYKYSLSKKAETCNITNAWLKCYEILYIYRLIPLNADKFVYFDNAAFPGSFILATHHFVNTLVKIKEFKWYASSLITETSDTSEPLEDSYNLYYYYPVNWFMHKNNNGDISDINNLYDFQRQLKEKNKGEHSVDLYTCDLGTDVSNDYNSQEIKHFILSIGQIVSGLMTLKNNGHMVVKLYTIFEQFTISYISLLTVLFKEVTLSKPITSKRTNSEIYLICKYYKYPFAPNSIEMKVYNLFIEKLRKKDTTPFISMDLIPLQIEDLFNASKNITDIQIESLNQFIYIMNLTDSESRDRCQQKIIHENSKIKKKFSDLIVYPIHKDNQLIMRKVY